MPYKIGGVGIEFAADDAGRRVGGADLDTCRNPDGTIAPWAGAVIQRLNTCTEISPSGTGLKTYFTYDAAHLEALREIGLIRAGAGGKPGFGRKFANGGGEHAPAIEVHLGNRFFCVTDQLLDTTPVEFRHVSLDDLIWLLRDCGPEFAAKGRPQQKKANGRDDTRSGVAFRKGVALRRAGRTFDEMVRPCWRTQRPPTGPATRARPTDSASCTASGKPAGASAGSTMPRPIGTPSPGRTCSTSCWRCAKTPGSRSCSRSTKCCGRPCWCGQCPAKPCRGGSNRAPCAMRT